MLGWTEKDIGPYRHGNYLAEPDLDHAAAHMRWVAADREPANAIGMLAARTIQDALSPVVVGAMIKERLQLLLSGCGHQPASSLSSRQQRRTIEAIAT